MARNKKGRNIHGILLLNKAKGISSNYALQQIKHLFFAKKAGHTGSLDPLATGILPICLGEATKLASFLLNDKKSYYVIAELGKTTTTLDSEGEITKTYDTSKINKSLIKQVLIDFSGEIAQVPPMYSALKQQGVPLYKLARKGIEVARKPRKIIIFNINFENFKNNNLTLTVDCSKGTYIRTLIDDIGQKLGCGAFVKELHRTKFAHFDLNATINFKDLQKPSDNDYTKLDKKLLKPEDILPNFNSVQLNEEQIININFGRKINLNLTNQTVKMFDKHIFIGIGIVNNNILQPKKLMVYNA